MLASERPKAPKIAVNSSVLIIHGKKKWIISLKKGIVLKTSRLVVIGTVGHFLQA